MDLVVQRDQRDLFKVFLRVLYAVSLAIYIFFIIDGIQYYQLSDLEKPHHISYRDLRPAGFQGQGFGILGSAMMFFMLFYSVRKRFKFCRNWGNLKHWLDIHIYFGVMGPLFIILHTSFKVSGLIAISFWSMIIVALSGFLGRYLYLQIPRNYRGNELSLKEISLVNENYDRELRETLNLDNGRLLRLDELITSEINRNKGIFRILVDLVFYDIFRPLFIRKLKYLFAKELQIGEPFLHRVIQLAWQKMKLHRRAFLLNRLQQLFHYWHVLHKPFAIIMYVILFCHIGVAIWLGYTWVL